MSVDEMQAVAALHPGIEVRHGKRGGWYFVATFHTTSGRSNRYAGKSIERAIELRAALIAQFSKRRVGSWKRESDRGEH